VLYIFGSSKVKKVRISPPESYTAARAIRDDIFIAVEVADE
jgi:hypothetical protein